MGTTPLTCGHSRSNVVFAQVSEFWEHPVVECKVTYTEPKAVALDPVLINEFSATRGSGSEPSFARERTRVKAFPRLRGCDQRRRPRVARGLEINNRSCQNCYHHPDYQSTDETRKGALPGVASDFTDSSVGDQTSLHQQAESVRWDPDPPAKKSRRSRPSAGDRSPCQSQSRGVGLAP